MNFAGLSKGLAVIALVGSIATTASAQTYKMTTPIAPGVSTPDLSVTSPPVNFRAAYERNWSGKGANHAQPDAAGDAPQAAHP